MKKGKNFLKNFLLFLCKTYFFFKSIYFEIQPNVQIKKSKSSKSMKNKIYYLRCITKSQYRMKFFLLLLLLPVLVAAQIDTTSHFHGPLVITKGGHYSGNYKNKNGFAVWVQTSDSVWLENLYAIASSDAVHCETGAKVIVDNLRCESIKPIDAAQRGWGFYAYKADYIYINHMYLKHTGGLRIDQQVANKIVITQSIIKNTDRRNGYGQVKGTSIAPALQLNDIGFTNGSELSYIYFWNLPNNSSVEDNINIHNSGGTNEHPLIIHDIFVDGAYPYPADSINFTGTGITMDGDNATNATTTQFVNVYNCQFIRTMNAAMNLPVGHDIHYENNRIINAGYIMQKGKKTYLPMSWSATASWNMNKASLDTVMYNNTIQNNFIGYYSKSANFKYSNRQDENQQPDSYIVTPRLNQYFPDQEITTDDENNEIKLWNEKTAGMTIGCWYKAITTPLTLNHDNIVVAGK